VASGESSSTTASVFTCRAASRKSRTDRKGERLRIPVIRIVDGYGEELWVIADHFRAIQRGNVVPLETGVTQTDLDREERPGRLPFGLARRGRER
jgi:hypothetical protein